MRRDMAFSVDDTQPRMDELQSSVNNTEHSLYSVVAIKPRVDEMFPPVDEMQPRVDDTQSYVVEMKPWVDEMLPRVDEMQLRVDVIDPNVDDMCFVQCNSWRRSWNL